MLQTLLLQCWVCFDKICPHFCSYYFAELITFATADRAPGEDESDTKANPWPIGIHTTNSRHHHGRSPSIWLHIHSTFLHFEFTMVRIAVCHTWCPAFIILYSSVGILLCLYYKYCQIWRLSSSRSNQMYYMFGFLFLVFLILVITCSETTILLCYFHLCAEVSHFFVVDLTMPFIVPCLRNLLDVRLDRNINFSTIALCP